MCELVIGPALPTGSISGAAAFVAPSADDAGHADRRGGRPATEPPCLCASVRPVPPPARGIDAPGAAEGRTRPARTLLAGDAELRGGAWTRSAAPAARDEARTHAAFSAVPISLEIRGLAIARRRLPETTLLPLAMPPLGRPSPSSPPRFARLERYLRAEARPPRARQPARRQGTRVNGRARRASDFGSAADAPNSADRRLLHVGAFAREAPRQDAPCRASASEHDLKALDSNTFDAAPTPAPGGGVPQRAVFELAKGLRASDEPREFPVVYGSGREIGLG